MTVTEADSTLGRRKSTVWNPPANSREFKVVYPLKADYYILHATTEGTLAHENRLSRLHKNSFTFQHTCTTLPKFHVFQLLQRRRGEEGGGRRPGLNHDEGAGEHGVSACRWPRSGRRRRLPHSRDGDAGLQQQVLTHNFIKLNGKGNGVTDQIYATQVDQDTDVPDGRGGGREY